MNIILICGTLEPGRDGVGDYTSRLALELEKAGQRTSILAINDFYVASTSIPDEHLLADTGDILRLSHEWSYDRRFKLAKSWIENKDPAWLSLQFVAFSFQRLGLPLGLSSFLKKLGRGRRWHIMFHELWVGMPATADTKYALWGWLQQVLISRMIDKLNPEVMHTQCMLYQAQLQRVGFGVGYLPLFSNIPVNAAVPKLKKDTHEFRDSLSLIVFGTIHPQAYFAEFAAELLRFCRKFNVKSKVILVGKCGSHQHSLTSILEVAGIPIEVMGEQSTKVISDLLLSADIGISTCAPPMIDKSGTVVAMLEHNLPVICIGHRWQPRQVQMPDKPHGILDFYKGCIEDCLMVPKNTAAQFSSKAAANRLLEDLSLN